ncbi:type II secretion system F domain protein [Thermoclostridium stercorarium subsp. stercorarium DSM 8532]|uniref:Type II secretion system F domain protein n=1 Tax=Thermoclostridium stercorarium (strain ATCC 35414 / DSM 8532 / NCIMB 11754) TaxID=1121335 RepID=L7VJX4_THES1|nr:type II secretion system F domain protein [Thermoclostridium stercorarium]AGC68430.1 type II secretion system F domain protein [Thermoclostridium stercorarium subsp. stercorarium DSM 8532]UZQ84429.1 type II secretion protein F [Thermoclostridium stercorarium]
MSQTRTEEFYIENYDKYNYKIHEWIIYSAVGVLVMAVIGWIFYRKIIPVAFISALGLFYPKIRKRQLIETRRNILRLQFKDMLYYIGAALSAGKSVEQAFVYAHGILRNLYPGKKAYIVNETELIIKRLQMNENIENILKDFAARSGVEEIQHFSDVFSVCKRTGGNLVEVIRTTSGMIGERIEIKQEIEIGLAAKKQEQRILSLSSVMMVLFISLMSGEFMEPMFATSSGRIIMTFSLILLGVGIFVSNRIMNIRF